MTNVRGSSRRLLNGAAIVLGSLFLLLVSLTASAFLSFSALERAQMELLSQEYNMAGREAAAQIEEGLRFGRPLAQFLGLDTILDDLRAMPGVAAAGLTDADGVPLGEWALNPVVEQDANLQAAVRELRAAGAGATERARSAEPIIAGARRYFLTPLHGRDDALAGVLIVAVPLAELSAALDRAVSDAVGAMLVISGVAAGLLAVAAGNLRSAMLRRSSGQAVARWRWMLLPLVVLLSAQTAYAAFILQIMRADLAAAAETGAARIVERGGDDLDQLLSLGLTFDRMPGLEDRMSGELALNSAVERLVLEDASGTVRMQVERVPDDEPGWLAARMPVPQAGVITRELTGPDGNPAGRLRARIDNRSIAAGLAEQVIRMLTVAATSAFVMIELFILLQIVLRPAVAPPGGASAMPGAAARASHEHASPVPEARDAVDKGPLHLVARPVMFAFVLSWALPLSFLPLKMRSLGGQLWGLPEDLVLALPISAEMGAALAMAILAGRLADRVGWSWPFLFGLALSVLGGVAAALAPDSASFILARAVTGLGYGLAWMGLQAFVVQSCGPQRRGQALANLMAGILAGFIVGTAIGGILAEQFGRDLVLLATGVAVLAPLAVALVTLRPFLRVGAPRNATPSAAADGPGGAATPGGWTLLLRSPEYMGVLMLSVVPFSIAQVGLLYFAVPLHLDRIGAAAADAGRILMVYGVVVILFGPMLSRVIDQSRLKAPIVVAGGLVGGLGLTLLLVDMGLVGIFLAAALLSLSSTLIEPARAALVMRLPAVQAAGPASALGLQRAADKLGQMVGPVAIAVILPAADMMDRVAGLGLGFAAASLLLAAVVMVRHPKRSTGT
nr:MFS transporter [Lutimaribacter sp. EGI FJ00013]